MSIRVNDPRKLEEWIVRTDQRLRELEARRLDAMDGLEQDHATKQIKAKMSGDGGNAAAIGSDGGIYAPAAPNWSAEEHSPLIIQKYMTAAAVIGNSSDTLINWSAEGMMGSWTTTASTITIPEDGWYHVTLHWPWADNANGNRVLHMTLNSTSVTTGSVMAAGGDPEKGEFLNALSNYQEYVAGDVLRVYAFQSSGVTLNGGTPYFGSIRGQWTVAKYGDSFPPNLISE